MAVINGADATGVAACGTTGAGDVGGGGAEATIVGAAAVRAVAAAAGGGPAGVAPAADFDGKAGTSNKAVGGACGALASCAWADGAGVLTALG